MRSRGTRNKSLLIDKMAKMAHLSIIDFLKEFTSKEFERQGKGIWNYLKFHCSLKMWNLSILNQSIRKQKRHLNEVRICNLELLRGKNRQSYLF